MTTEIKQCFQSLVPNLPFTLAKLPIHHPLKITYLHVRVLGSELLQFQGSTAPSAKYLEGYSPLSQIFGGAIPPQAPRFLCLCESLLVYRIYFYGCTWICRNIFYNVQEAHTIRAEGRLPFKFDGNCLISQLRCTYTSLCFEHLYVGERRGSMLINIPIIKTYTFCVFCIGI